MELEADLWLQGFLPTPATMEDDRRLLEGFNATSETPVPFVVVLDTVGASEACRSSDGTRGGGATIVMTSNLSIIAGILLRRFAMVDGVTPSPAPENDAFA